MSHTAGQIAKYPVLQPSTLAAGYRASESAIRASFDRACATVPPDAPAAVSTGAGLVPFKTSLESLDLCINIAPSAVAERRVKRLKKSVWASGHLHGMAQNGFRAAKPWFVTLTYASANGWIPKHVSDAVQAFRKWCMARDYPCRYTWVAEIQPKRLERTGESVVHYHLLAWLPVGVNMPHWDRPTRTPSGRHRAAFWPHGMSNTEIAKSGVGYLMKYLSKLGELTRFPKGLRLYGIGGLCDQGRAVRSWLNLPEWVKSLHGVGEVFRAGAALVVRATGEILEPAYSVRLIPSGLILTKLRELPARWFDGAYSSVSFS
jgi:hypothetical protein